MEYQPDQKKYLGRFTLFELVLLSLIAALGIAVKPLVVSITHIVTGPLNIPGGAFSGGLYMMFPVLGGAVVRKRGSASFVCLIQAIVVMISGIYGSHGAASIITYMAPGLAVDILWLIMKAKGDSMMSCFAGGMAANIVGTALVNLIFFRLPAVPLLLISSIALFSGGIGGLIAWQIAKHIRSLNVFT